MDIQGIDQEVLVHAQRVTHDFKHADYQQLSDHNVKLFHSEIVGQFSFSFV